MDAGGGREGESALWINEGGGGKKRRADRLKFDILKTKTPAVVS